MDASADLLHTLEEVGFSEKEAAVYVALLSLETATAYQIAAHCDVKKPTVYVILEDLRKKGLVLKVPHAKKALFAAQDLNEYLRVQESRLKAARSIMPKLHALGSKPKESVYFFNGLRGMAQAMDYKLDSMHGKIFYSFYGNLENTPEAISKMFGIWDKKAISSNVAFRLIMPEKNKDRQKNLLALAKEEREQIQIHFLNPYEYPGNVSLEIGKDFVRIMDAKNLYATVIDDSATADAMRQIFKIVWERGV